MIILLGESIVWLTIAGMGVVTFLLRLSFIVFLGRMRLPGWVKRGLDFVPPAVFSALILPDIVQFSTIWQPPLYGHSRFIAGVVAILTAWRSRNVMLTIIVGLVTLWGLQTLL